MPRAKKKVEEVEEKAKEVVEEQPVEEQEAKVEEVSILEILAGLEQRVSDLEANYSVLEEMITKGEEIEAEEEPLSKERWAAIQWVREGFEKGQLHWETIVPRVDDEFMYQQTTVNVYKGKKMTVPHCIAAEIRSREAR